MAKRGLSGMATSKGHAGLVGQLSGPNLHACPIRRFHAAQQAWETVRDPVARKAHQRSLQRANPAQPTCVSSRLVCPRRSGTSGLHARPRFTVSRPGSRGHAHLPPALARSRADLVLENLALRPRLLGRIPRVVKWRHAIRLVRDCIAYHHEDRTHLGLDKDTPLGRAVPSWLTRRRLPESLCCGLGGVLHQTTSISRISRCACRVC